MYNIYIYVADHYCPIVIMINHRQCHEKYRKGQGPRHWARQYHILPACSWKPAWIPQHRYRHGSRPWPDANATAIPVKSAPCSCQLMGYLCVSLWFHCVSVCFDVPRLQNQGNSCHDDQRKTDVGQRHCQHAGVGIVQHLRRHSGCKAGNSLKFLIARYRKS